MWPCVVVSGEPAVRVTTGSSSPSAWALFIRDTELHSIITETKSDPHTDSHVSQPSKNQIFVQIRMENNRPTGHRCANYTTLHTLALRRITRPPAKNHTWIVGGWTTVHRQTCTVISSGVGWNERRCEDPEPPDPPPVVPAAVQAMKPTPGWRWPAPLMLFVVLDPLSPADVTERMYGSGCRHAFTVGPRWPCPGSDCPHSGLKGSWDSGSVRPLSLQLLFGSKDNLKKRERQITLMLLFWRYAFGITYLCMCVYVLAQNSILSLDHLSLDPVFFLFYLNVKSNSH